MNHTKTAKYLLTILVAAAALSLAACGGGDSGGNALPAGKVGTVGDGVNAAEFEAVQCGMNKDQVTAIIGDAPTVIGGDVVWNWNYPATFTQIAFNTPTGSVVYKSTGTPGNAPTVTVKC